MSVKLAPAPSSVPKVSVRRKPAAISQTNYLLDDLCTLQEAIQMYPADKDSIKETGIPVTLLMKREHQTTHAGARIYLCPHEKCQTPPFYAQGLAAVYSHIQRKHPGLALACPYCANKVFWNSHRWKSHMDSKHSKAPTVVFSSMKRQLWLKRCYLPPSKLSPLMPLLPNEPAIAKVRNLAPRTVPKTLPMAVTPVPPEMNLYLQPRPNP